ncbi:MAG: symmetrical bis(5'-nucleosyl)-tetraphosphatase [Pseudomonadota bacterium]
MTRYAIGDIQGCHEPLTDLLRKMRFKADRDQLYFTGDLVNRGPQSLQVLRLVKSLGANARTVLGNHDLHLLAHHFDADRPMRRGDTLSSILRARDRVPLMEWLLHQPLLIHDSARNDLFVHAGLVPQWSPAIAARAACEAEAALRRDPRRFLATMYGDQPDRWVRGLKPADRWRFTINVLTRLRVCKADGTIDFRPKGAPDTIAAPWRPWFDQPRKSAKVRVIFGHWSALGLLRRPLLLGLDTGCVWGGKLTAVNLDDPKAPVIQKTCRACRTAGAD